MSKGKDANAPRAVLDYLNRQNRPYSAIDIFNNLHKEYGKTAVVKALESLAEKGTVREKTYGKQKVYVADQSQYPDVDENEMKEMDGTINSLSEQLKEITDKNKRLDRELTGLNSSMSTEEAKENLRLTISEIQQLATKLKNIKENNNAVSPEERKIIMTSREKHVKEWRKRKRMTNDILNAILEGYPKPKKVLYEEVGIETDEELNIKPPEL